jgi:hypothetical protein
LKVTDPTKKQANPASTPATSLSLKRSEKLLFHSPALFGLPGLHILRQAEFSYGWAFG